MGPELGWLVGIPRSHAARYDFFTRHCSLHCVWTRWIQAVVVE